MLRPQDIAAATVLALPDMSAWTGRAVDRSALLEFLRHGVRYAFCASRGAPTRGVPAGVLAPPLNTLLSATEGPGWPSVDGTARGYALAPLYRTAPAAARRDASVQEALALTDALREGGARERALAIRELRRRLERPMKTSGDG